MHLKKRVSYTISPSSSFRSQLGLIMTYDRLLRFSLTSSWSTAGKFKLSIRDLTKFTISARSIKLSWLSRASSCMLIENCVNIYQSKCFLLKNNNGIVVLIALWYGWNGKLYLCVYAINLYCSTMTRTFVGWIKCWVISLKFVFIFLSNVSTILQLYIT